MSFTTCTAAIQVASRVWVLWGIVNLVPEDTTQGSLRQLGPLSPTLTSLVVAWSLSEIIRYGFFAAKVPVEFVSWRRLPVSLPASLLC